MRHATMVLKRLSEAVSTETTAEEDMTSGRDLHTTGRDLHTTTALKTCYYESGVREHEDLKAWGSMSPQRRWGA